MKAIKRSILGASALAVGTILIMSTSSFAGLYRIATSAGWDTYQISSTNYTAVASDAVNNEKMIASRDGAVDVVYVNGGVWQTKTNAVVGKTYNALARSYSWGDYYYGSSAAGGIDTLAVAGDNSISASVISGTESNIYKAVAVCGGNNQAMIAARDGALDMVYVDRGSWVVWSNITTGRTYTDLTRTATWGNFYFGVWSGGIDKIQFNGSSWVASTVAGTAGKNYTAIQSDSIWDQYMYASQSNGAMDLVGGNSATPVAGANMAFGSLTPTAAWHQYMYGTELVPVPEPGSLATLSLGCLSAIGMMLRRRVCSK